MEMLLQDPGVHLQEHLRTFLHLLRFLQGHLSASLHPPPEVISSSSLWAPVPPQPRCPGDPHLLQSPGGHLDHLRCPEDPKHHLQ